MLAESKSRRARDPKPTLSSVEAVSPHDLHGKPVEMALQYWEKLRGTDPFPAREKISPRDMLEFLRNIALLRVIDGGADYEYRIAGDSYVQAFGWNFQGQRLSDFQITDPAYFKATHSVYEFVRNSGQPFALRGWVSPTLPSRFSYHETVFLPLGNNGVVDHLLTASVFTPRMQNAPEKLDVGTVLPEMPAEWKKA
jgi:PAS domain